MKRFRRKVVFFLNVNSLLYMHSGAANDFGLHNIYTRNHIIFDTLFEYFSTGAVYITYSHIGMMCIM